MFKYKQTKKKKIVKQVRFAVTRKTFKNIYFTPVWWKEETVGFCGVKWDLCFTTTKLWNK